MNQETIYQAINSPLSEAVTALITILIAGIIRYFEKKRIKNQSDTDNSK